jgi:hypothetical protein
MPDLSDTAKAVLDFEGLHWKHAGAKDAEIRERFKVSPTIYYKRLAVLIHSPGALAYAPSTVKRLQRLEEARRRVRTPS